MAVSFSRFLTGVWLSVLLFAWLSAASLFAKNWPQFRLDSNRGAASEESLPGSLTLQWTRQLPTPEPAYPGEIRLRYDATYEPVVLGEMMFVPSMVADSVTALDVETGDERWRFFTDGPVRFAPVACRDKVYFVSDDGHLYCVAAKDGKLLWKFRGLPKDREDRKLIGDGRLISLFPARGGPVLHEGVVYFGAGVWAGEGVFVHAVDAKSGKAIWSNTELGHIKDANMDHGVSYFAGLSPQGYLAVIGGKLVVPCGSQLPAVFDLKTGEVEHYTIGWGGRDGLPKGAWFVAGTGKYMIHGGDLYDISTPNEERFRDSRGRSDFKHMLYVGGLTRLQIDRTNQKGLGDFRTPVLTPETMYCRDQGITAYDLTKAKIEERAKSPVPNYRKNDKYPDKLRAVFDQRWKLPSKSRIHIAAGDRLYCGAANRIESIAIPPKNGEPTVGWHAEIAGTPHSVLAAAGRLFVVTREGQILAFGEKKPDKVASHPMPSKPAPPEDRWTKEAAKILKEAKLSDGYAIVLGVGSGRLAEEIVRQSRCDVIAIDPDAAKVNKLRAAMCDKGLYGSRIAIHTADPKTFRFPPYLASLIVSEDPSVLGDCDAAFVKRLAQSLRPYGGTMAITRPGKSISQTRSGPLPDTADWSHRNANAANTGASQDHFLAAPLTRLWFDGSFRWERKPGHVVVRVAGGRLLMKTHRELRAFDVYTGRCLWTVPASSGEMVAVDDAIHLVNGRSLKVLDVAGGEQTAQIDLPKELTRPLANLRIADDRIVGNSGNTLVAMDRSGKLLWKSDREKPIGSIAMGNGSVFCGDAVQRRRGQPEPTDVATTAHDLRSGKQLWRVDGSEARYSEPLDLLVTSRGAFRAKDGEEVWRGPGFGRITHDRLIRGNADEMFVHDLKTGKQLGGMRHWNRRGCTSLRASANLLTSRFRGNAAYVDLESGEITSIWNVRAACSNNLFPANGVLNVPGMTGGCTCNYIPTSQAFVPSSAFE